MNKKTGNNQNTLADIQSLQTKLTVAIILLIPIIAFLFWRLLDIANQAKLVTRLDDLYVTEKPCKAELYDGKEQWINEYVRDADITVDFESLKQRNPDVVGWIRIDNTNISYPVLEKEGSPAEYLNKDIDGKQSSFGSICKHSWYNTVHPLNFWMLYGHNAQYPKIMFHDVERFYSDDEFFNEGNRIRYYLPNGGMLVYRVIYAGVEKTYTQEDTEDPSFVSTFKLLDLYPGYEEKNRAYRKMLMDGTYNNDSPGTKIMKELELEEDTPMIGLQTCVANDDSHMIYVVGVIEEADTKGLS